AEVIAIADLVENLKERVARFRFPQQRHAPVATARDEMPVAETISPFQLVSHQEPKNRTFQKPKRAAPSNRVRNVVKFRCVIIRLPMARQKPIHANPMCQPPAEQIAGG